MQIRQIIHTHILLPLTVAKLSTPKIGPVFDPSCTFWGYNVCAFIHWGFLESDERQMGEQFN